MSHNPFKSFFAKNKSLFTKGNVFYMKDYSFGDGKTRNKFLVVLNQDIPNNNPVIIVLPTSQTEKYEGFAFSERNSQDTLLIEADEIPNIFTKKTIIDCASTREKK